MVSNHIDNSNNMASNNHMVNSSNMDNSMDNLKMVNMVNRILTDSMGSKTGAKNDALYLIFK
jgi:hypothetical protein